MARIAFSAPSKLRKPTKLSTSAEIPKPTRRPARNASVISFRSPVAIVVPFTELLLSNRLTGNNTDEGEDLFADAQLDRHNVPRQLGPTQERGNAFGGLWTEEDSLTVTTRR